MANDAQFPQAGADLVTDSKKPTRWWYDWLRKVNTRIEAAQSTADAAAIAAAEVPEPVYPVIDGLAPIQVVGPDDHRTIFLDSSALSGGNTIIQWNETAADEPWPLFPPPAASSAGGQAAIQFTDEGSNLSTSGAVTSVDFVGAGVTATAVGTAVTVTISGASTTAPTVTWNSADKSANLTLTNSDKTVTKTAAGDAHSMVRATYGPFVMGSMLYWEVKVTADDANRFNMIGLADPDDSLANTPGQGLGIGYYGADAKIYKNGAAGSTYATFTTNDIIGVAWIVGYGVWFAKNNTWQGGGNPATKKLRQTLSTVGLYPAVSIYKGSSVASLEARFKAADQTYSPPTGFSAIGS